MNSPSPTLPRNNDGTFAAGVSGNPAGRPLGKRNEITDIQQDLELAIRKRMSADRIGRIVDELITRAEQGSIQAARLVLDKVLPNAKTLEEDTTGLKSLVIRIENATFGAKDTAGETYDGQVVSPVITEGNVNE